MIGTHFEYPLSWSWPVPKTQNLDNFLVFMLMHDIAKKGDVRRSKLLSLQSRTIHPNKNWRKGFTLGHDPKFVFSICMPKTIVLSSYLHLGIRFCGFVVTWCMNGEKEKTKLSKCLLLGTTNELDSRSTKLQQIEYHNGALSSNFIRKDLATKTNTRTNAKFG